MCGVDKVWVWYILVKYLYMFMCHILNLLWCDSKLEWHLFSPFSSILIMLATKWCDFLLCRKLISTLENQGTMHDKVYQLTKHEFSSPGRGKSRGVHASTLNLTSYSAPFFVLLWVLIHFLSVLFWFLWSLYNSLNVSHSDISKMKVSDPASNASLLWRRTNPPPNG